MRVADGSAWTPEGFETLTSALEHIKTLDDPSRAYSLFLDTEFGKELRATALNVSGRASLKLALAGNFANAKSIAARTKDYKMMMVIAIVLHSKTSGEYWPGLQPLVKEVLTRTEHAPKQNNRKPRNRKKGNSS